MSSPGLPADINRVLVQGQFLNLRGEAQTGQVTFTPNLTWTIDAANKQVITGVPITAPLDATGSFSIYLPCTDDTDLNPTIGSYMVVDPAGRAYNMLVPVGSGTIDLSQVVPAGPSTPGVVQLLVGPPGPAGIGATKLTDLTDVTTTGAAVGKVLAVATVDGSGNLTGAGLLDPADPASSLRATLDPNYAAPDPDLFNWHAALLDCANRRATVMFVGDSIREDYPGTLADADRRGNILRDALRARYPSGALGGDGFVPARYNYSGRTAWTFAGGSTVNQAHGLGLRAVQMFPARTATITKRCTSFDLHFYQLSTDTFTISIDGGAAATYSPPTGGSGTARATKWNSGALVEGDHTIVVTSTAGGGALCGGRFYRGDEAKGVHVIDASFSGALTNTFTGTAGGSNTTSTTWADFIQSGIVDPSLIVLGTLVNDCSAITAAQYKTDMQALINVVRARSAATILLMPPWEPSDRTTISPWNDYLAALASLAVTNAGVVFRNLSRRVPKQTGDPNGLLYDLVHFNAKGQRALASLELNALDTTAPPVTTSIYPPVPAANYFIPVGPGVSTTIALGGGNLALAPWVVQRTISLARLGAEVTVAGDVGSKLRLAIYADNGSGYPGNLVVDAGQINGDSATSQELTISVTLLPGLYWIGAVAQSVTTTGPTTRVLSNFHSSVPLPLGASFTGGSASRNGFTTGFSAVPAACPTTFPTGQAAGANMPRLYARTA